MPVLEPQFIEKQKEKLINEEKKLVEQIETIATPDPKEPGDFVPKFEDMGADEDDNAQEVDQYQTNASREEVLETRLSEVRAALKRIEEGTYGKCSEGDDIPLDRLEAYPEASTCADHAK